jgi:preprotein translocase subunit YajC
MNHLWILLDQAPAAGASSGLINLLFIGVIIVVFYFFMMRPQIKKQKEQQNFMKEIGKGDKIVTIGGIIGKIIEANEKTFLIETEGQRLRILRSAVSLENSRALNDGKFEPKEKSEEDKKS